MNLIEKKYEELCKKRSDIWEHLPTLKKYSQECTEITEFGVRGGDSTWALLVGQPGKLTSYDIRDCTIQGLKELASENGTNFKFIVGDTLKIEIEETDLLFIDTLHNYTQLSQELKLHGNKAKKYIIMHDTTSFEWNGESYIGKKERGIWPAISEFLEQNPHWSIKERFTNNNGLTIISRE
jgi:hypothetical protein